MAALDDHENQKIESSSEGIQTCYRCKTSHEDYSNYIQRQVCHNTTKVVVVCHVELQTGDYILRYGGSGFVIFSQMSVCFERGVNRREGWRIS